MALLSYVVVAKAPGAKGRRSFFEVGMHRRADPEDLLGAETTSMRIDSCSTPTRSWRFCVCCAASCTCRAREPRAHPRLASPLAPSRVLMLLSSVTGAARLPPSC